MSLFSSVWTRTFSLSLTVLVALLLTPTFGLAGKDHCRTLLLDGTAGDTSTDSVVFQLADKNGNTIIDQSCQITVQEGEEASEFGARLPIQWFLDDASLASPPCPTDAEALARATKPSGKIKYPKKVCSNSSGGSGPSCKIKFTYKVKKSTGEVKKGPQLEVCCYEGADCKGTKWGATTENPVNLRVRNNSVSLDFLPAPAALPAAIGATSDLIVDPIGIEQLPVPEIRACRETIATKVENFANRIYAVLRTCHSNLSLPDQSICNTVNPLSDPAGMIAAAVTTLRQEVRDACASLGSPAKFSYAECPAPCSGMITEPQCVGGSKNGLSCRTDADCDSAKRCAAGILGPACSVDTDCTISGTCLGSGFCAGPTCTTDADCDTVLGNGKCVRKGDGVCKNRCSSPGTTAGNPCSVDSDCDSAPSIGDGVCADWGEVGDCAVCLVQTAVENTMTTLFGATGSTLGLLSPEAQDCKLWLAQVIGQLQKVQLKETRSCQKLLDSGKTALPATAKKCQDADRKGKRAKAIAYIQATLEAGKHCAAAALSELDSCSTDPLNFGICSVAAIRPVNRAYADGAIPDSRCGDGKRIGEQCDDGNTSSGDGCAADCTCEGICGDGARNPLSVCGELCDDGNSTNGDGCDNNCTPTGCGNGIITTGEQCEADSDCAGGQPCIACICGGSSSVCPTAMVWKTQSDGGLTTLTEYDVGWTGIAHGPDRVAGATVKLGLNCGAGSPPNCGLCAITGIDPAPGNCRCSNDNRTQCTEPFAPDAACGGATCNCYLSPPEPFSFGGVSFCALPILASQVSGSWDVDAGGGAVSVDERSRIHLGISIGQPCPLCLGDPVPNDDLRGGTCNGGPNAGAACDVDGTEPTFGAVSYDCFPNPALNISGLGLAMKRTETTGSVNLAAGLPCSPPFDSLACPCAVCSGDTSLPCSSDT